ncbi:hypothetical protein SAMN05216464_104383, partial [Mucilaginibacter pineti]
QFAPEWGGQFEPGTGGHFKPEWGGQFERNLHPCGVLAANTLLSDEAIPLFCLLLGRHAAV